MGWLVGGGYREVRIRQLGCLSVTSVAEHLRGELGMLSMGAQRLEKLLI